MSWNHFCREFFHRHFQRLKVKGRIAMPEGVFDNDYFSRAVMRLLLILQLTALVIVLAFILMGLVFPALVISFLTFLILIGVILWLYVRYQALPVVCQKKELERLVLKFQKNLKSETDRIHESKKERERLFQAEKIENGLAAASLKQALITGIGPRWKERLADHGILSAADVSNPIPPIPGLGESKRQSLLGWRGSVLVHLESTKPSTLPPTQIEIIKQNYQVLHDKNNAAERQASTSQQILEHELISLKPRLHQLAGVTFPAYLSHSLASRAAVAALLASVVIVVQVASSVSATGFAIIASNPTPTATPTATGRPSRTPAATITPTRTMTNTSVPTLTVTSTTTARPTLAQLRGNTPTLAPASVEGSNCHPSYPGVCIPAPPPDLDCSDISFRRFQVLPPDPHNFDGDGDGLGCES
jgi:hypothetical protein